NRHSEGQIALLAKVIREQGWRAPITVSRRSGLVVAGHGRLEAAKHLDLDLVPVDYQDFATEAEEHAHMLADNRLAELADLDTKAALELLNSLSGSIDLDLTGFDAAGLAALGLGPSKTVDAEPQIDKAAELAKKWKVKAGQVWELGGHRLMCGDCRTLEDVTKVLNGDSIGMVWTDPPYGVGYEEKCKHLEKYRPQNRKSSLVSSDDLTPDETEKLATDALRLAFDNAENGCPIYVAVPAGPL